MNADSSLRFVIMAEAKAVEMKDGFAVDQAALVRSFYYARKDYVDSSLHITDLLIEKYKNDNRQLKFFLDVMFFKAKILDRGNRYTQSLTPN